jgi:hypothetical protein
MYAWAHRRQLHRDGAAPQAIGYARRVEATLSTFAEDAMDDLRRHVDGLVRGDIPEPPDTGEREASDAARAYMAKADAAVRSVLAESAADPDVLARVAAAGVVVSCWRDVIEAWHYFFTNAEMAWMSMVTTRDVAPYCDLAANRVDWQGLAAVLADAEREVLPNTTSQDAFGPAWRVIASRLERGVADEHRDGITAATYVQHALTICPEWWGCPQWTPLARRIARKLKLDQQHKTDLIVAPCELSFDVWERVIDAIG